MKKYMLIFAIVSAFGALFSSCAKLPAYQSVRVETMSDDELTTPDISKYYSAANKIKYGVSNNDSMVFVRMEIEDRMTQMKFLRTGFKMYIDTTGKKREGQYIEYPVGRTKGASADQRNGSGGRGAKGTMDLPMMISRLDKEVFYSCGGELTQYTMHSQEMPFLLNIRIENSNTIIWEVAVPMSMIGSYNVEKGFSIGLVSGAFEMPSGMSGGGPGASMGGGERPGGGRPGGGMPGGGMGGSDSRPSMDNMQSMSEPIEMWFRVLPGFTN